MNDTNYPEKEPEQEDSFLQELEDRIAASQQGQETADAPMADFFADVAPEGEQAAEDFWPDEDGFAEEPAVEAFQPKEEIEAEAAEYPSVEEQDEPAEIVTVDGDGYRPDDAHAPSEDERAMHPRKERSPRKRRPRRNKGSGLLSIPQMISAVLWVLMILAIGVSLGRMVWVCAADVLAFGREEKSVVISVTSSDTLDTISEKLAENGLVRYPGLFKKYAELSHAEKKITTGTFTLSTVYDYHALVSQMSPKSSNRAVVENVLIPEGYTCRQIFALLERKGVCAASELEAYAADGELKDYWFLEGVARGDKYCLEGYLFPDTYDFYENSSPKAALEKMLNGFQTRLTEEIYAALPALNEHLTEMMAANGCTEEYIAENQLDLRQVITVASLIEKEMATADEAPLIASVIYNRLTQDQAFERYLNIDAAIFYALGEHKEALTAEDLQVDSPYNTYTYSGLVPGPIASPGLACINAALNPAATEYYYYVLEPAVGTHHFSKTFEEHEKYVEQLRAANG